MTNMLKLVVPLLITCSFVLAVEPLKLPPRPKRIVPLSTPVIPKIVSDGTSIDGVDAVLSRSQDDWFLSFVAPLTDNIGIVPSNSKLQILPSFALEKMTATLKTWPDCQFRVWGRLTQYQGKNFVFLAAFIVLRPEPNMPAPAPANDSAPKTQILTNEPNDAIVIPEEVMAALKPKRTIDLADLGTSVPEIEQNVVFSTRSGFVVEDAPGHYIFKPDALGRSVQMVSFTIMPNQVLEDCIKTMNSVPERVRFRATGILTKYNGQYQMLLQSAKRQFSHGNFSR